MTGCGCQTCLQRHRNGLPSLAGLSLHPTMHIVAEDLIDQPAMDRQIAETERRAIEDARRAVVVARPAARGRFVRERTVGKIVRLMRSEAEARAAELERRIDKLEAVLQTERRLAELERRLGADPVEPGDELPEFRSWRQ
jgi:hypothetical protein